MLCILDIRNSRPILVPLNNDEIDKEVDQPNKRREQVKVVQIVTINLILNQPFSTVSNRMYRNSWNSRPILVPLNNDEIDKEVDQPNKRREQVKVVQIVTINLILNQPFSTVSNRMYWNSWSLGPVLVPLNNDEIDNEVDQRTLRPILALLNNDKIDKEVDQAH
ncbi:uncharacterized protein G2W53_010771 [Senna tora]|uniref:Uncharacterized protein n=1 Tax=Senna tora TaxID=362788 RepID=A0A834X097_9FABA|nr:uncharacterized protein G2W53_010771 [Senna tora]